MTRIPTSVVTAGSLVAGWQVARRTGVRPLGGLVLAAGGAVAGRQWQHAGGTARTALLSSAYVAAFGLSHPLSRRIGSWPSVLAVSAATAGVCWAVHDRHA